MNPITAIKNRVAPAASDSTGALSVNDPVLLVEARYSLAEIVDLLDFYPNAVAQDILAILLTKAHALLAASPGNVATSALSQAIQDPSDKPADPSLANDPAIAAAPPLAVVGGQVATLEPVTPTAPAVVAPLAVTPPVAPTTPEVAIPAPIAPVVPITPVVEVPAPVAPTAPIILVAPAIDPAVAAAPPLAVAGAQVSTLEPAPVAPTAQDAISLG